MMKNKMLKYVCCLLLWLPVGRTMAQQPLTYRTLKLEEIAGRLADRGIRLTEEGLYDASVLCPGKRVEMKKDIFGRVGFIGLHLFDEETRKGYASPVYDFMERYLLELLLLSEEDRRVKLYEDKVEVLLDGMAYEKGMRRLTDFVLFVGGESPFSIQSDSAGYKAGWRVSVGTVALVFPKQYELIFGSDKAEMEKGLMEELARVEAKRTLWDTLPVKDLLPTARKGYYVRRGTSYLIPELQTDTYYKQLDAERCVLIFEKGLPGESLANLFQEGFYGDRRVAMKIKHRCYGNQITEFEVDVQNWVEYCRKQKCYIYFGPETLNDTEISGTVLVVNPDLGYNHILYFRCATDIFDRKRPSMDVDLYTYVPTHNIKDLFYDYRK